MKITSEIYQVGGDLLTSPEDAAVYVINFGGHGALVDAGCGRYIDRICENIQAGGTSLEQVEYILLTHCHYDHTGGAKVLSEKMGCPIVAHEKAAKYLEQGDDEVTAAIWYGASLEPFKVHKKISGEKEDISLGVRTITGFHIPGHSPGSMAYLTESEGLKILFAQDVHGPLHQSLLSDEALYRKSLQLLIDLQADVLCEGHFGVYKGKKEVADFISSFL